MEKYTKGMSCDDMRRNSNSIDSYFYKKGWGGDPSKRDWSGLKCVGYWSDVRFWADGDGNIWEEYVPTYD